MQGIWLVSYLALWFFVIFQAVLVFILFREFGVRLLHTAAGISRDGLPVGTNAPKIEARDLENMVVPVPTSRDRSTLLVFGSSHCNPCRMLAPHLNRFAAKRKGDLNVYFVTAETVESNRETAHELGLDVPVLSSRDGADTYKASVSPFAFMVDRTGVVRAKGLVNGLEGLELLWKQHHTTDIPQVAQVGSAIS